MRWRLETGETEETRTRKGKGSTRVLLNRAAPSPLQASLGYRPLLKHDTPRFLDLTRKACETNNKPCLVGWTTPLCPSMPAGAKCLSATWKGQTACRSWRHWWVCRGRSLETSKRGLAAAYQTGQNAPKFSGCGLRWIGHGGVVGSSAARRLLRSTSSVFTVPSKPGTKASCSHPRHLSLFLRCRMMADMLLKGIQAGQFRLTPPLKSNGGKVKSQVPSSDVHFVHTLKTHMQKEYVGFRGRVQLNPGCAFNAPRVEIPSKIAEN